MMNVLIASESRDNQASEVVGKNWDTNRGNYDLNQGIKGGQALTVLFKPLSGLLKQNKMLPIRYAPIQIELELADGYLDAIVDPAALATDVVTDTNTSTDWQIENVQAKVDVCMLDNALDNSYAQHLLAGKSPRPSDFLQHLCLPT